MSIRAVIYARSSTRGQRERHTTRYQVEACRTLAMARAYEVVAELVDESVSGRVPMIERSETPSTSAVTSLIVDTAPSSAR